MSELVSIILCCFNSERFLAEAIDSVLQQDYKNIELVFVNDGSTDNSLAIAEGFCVRDKRMKIFNKVNGGLNTARNFGAKHVSVNSKALLFFDADDILDSTMIGKLLNTIISENNVGAAYCTYRNIDENGYSLKSSVHNNRLLPTKYWVKKLHDSEKYTSFFSIYSWTLMSEACTMIRKDLFFKFGEWDEKNFPQGETYGESIPLFGVIALHHKIVFVNEELYLYRRHSGQITSGKFDMNKIQKKIDKIMIDKTYNSSFALVIKKAIIFNRYRLPLYNYLSGSLRYELRHRHILAVKDLTNSFLKYIYSLPYFLRNNENTKTI